MSRRPHAPRNKPKANSNTDIFISGSSKSKQRMMDQWLDKYQAGMQHEREGWSTRPYKRHQDGGFNSD